MLQSIGSGISNTANVYSTRANKYIKGAGDGITNLNNVIFDYA